MGLVVVTLAAAAATGAALGRWRRRGDAVAGLAPKLAFSAAVVVLVASCVALGAEVWFRFLHDATDSFGITKTTARWFERHYRLNAWGVRDDVEYTVRKTDRRRRVTFLGDSFTAGQGVEQVTDRFANLVRAAHPDWEVHVLARNGLDTTMEVRFFEQALERGYQTDDVVLVYCLNDVVELIPEWRAAVARIYREAESLSFLVEHSFAANQLYFRLFRARDPEVGDYFGAVARAYDGPIWQEQARALRHLVRVTRRAGIRLWVVTFPFLHALGDPYPYAAAHARLDALWRSERVPHLDLLSVYAGMAHDELVVSEVDAHPNERAHALAAQAIDRFLAERPASDATGAGSPAR